MSPALVEAIGFLASLTAFVLWLPQAGRTWRQRGDVMALSGVSVWTQVGLLTNALLWAIYALGTGAFWVGAPGLINGPLAVTVIILVLRARRRTRAGLLESGGPSCPWCREGLWHRTFITAPAGWGSLMECTGAPAAHGVLVSSVDEAKAMRATRT